MTRIRPILVLAAGAAALLSAAPPSAAQYVRISVSTSGTLQRYSSHNPSLDASGRFVAFESQASELTFEPDWPGGAAPHLYLRDRDSDEDGVFDEPGGATTTLVSVGLGGQRANSSSRMPRMAAGGRYVVFVSVATNLVAGLPARFIPQQVYRYDRVTRLVELVSRSPSGAHANQVMTDPVVSADGRYVAFVGGATNLTGDATPGVFVRDMATGVTRKVANGACVQPSISDDGATITCVSRSDTGSLGQLGATLAGTVTLIDRATLAQQGVGRGFTALMSGNAGVYVAMGLTPTMYGTNIAEVYTQTIPGAVRTPSGLITAGLVIDVSTDGRYGLVPAWQQPGASLLLYDRLRRRALPFPYGNRPGGSVDGAARYLAFESDYTPPGLTPNGITRDVYVADLDQLLDLDRDGDTLDDRDERFYGLSATSGAGDDGPDGNPDRDGLTNATELAAGSHPRGFHIRYLAEGATGAFFQTRIALANPDLNPAHGAATLLRFSRADGVQKTSRILVPGGGRRTIDAAAVDGLGTTDFSTTVESDRPLVEDRTMTWGAHGAGDAGYGAHSETSTAAPAAHWYLAEGSTVLDFDLFYLLSNPQPSSVVATVRFLRPSGAPLVRSYNLGPRSRTTVHVNAVDVALAETDVSADITSTAPIIVERAMYTSRSGQPFAVGTASKGVTAAATSWFLAEGATGSFFDTYVLIANPSPAPAIVEVRFDRPDGVSVVRTHTTPANSRFSIHVDGVPGLEATSVATTVTSSNGTPIVVERAMYWPGGFFDYYEGHSSAGVTTTGLRWALAEGESGGPFGARTYVLIANTSSMAGRARLTVLPEDGAASAPAELELPPNSRTTVPISGPLAHSRFGVLVESVGPATVPIVVEGAFYWTVDGVLWAAGSNVVATKLP